MEFPLVSVIIPTFNAAGLLTETLDSVLGQTYRDLEILVVDDGSTDDTAKVVEAYGDQVRYFKQDNWGGPSRPRNVGVQNAGGSLIAIFDSDDLMMPDKIETAVDVFRRHPEVSFTFSNFQGIDQQGAVHKDDFLARYRNFRRGMERKDGSPIGLIPGREIYRELLTANFIGTSSVMCRREVFDQVGPFDEAMLNADDVDMWRRIAFAGFRFAYIDRVLHSYRKTAGGVTARGAKRYPAILRGLRKQLDLDLLKDERSVLEKKLFQLELNYASALTEAADTVNARRIILGSLAKKPSWAGVKGLAKCLLADLRS